MISDQGVCVGVCVYTCFLNHVRLATCMYLAMWYTMHKLPYEAGVSGFVAVL